MAQKIYCTNVKCAKPIEYLYQKPNFCPHCGNSLIPKVAQNTSSPPSIGYVFKKEEPNWFSSQIQDPKTAAVQRKMKERAIREDDFDENDEDDDCSEDSSANIDFSNFSFKAKVHIPQETKLTLRDFMKMEAE